METMYYVSAAIAAVLLISCQNERFDGSGSDRLGVKVNAAASKEISTKSGDGIPYELELNGNTLFLTNSVNLMEPAVRNEDTKGSPISESGDGFDSFVLELRKDDNSLYTDPKGAQGPVIVSFGDSEWYLEQEMSWPSDEDESVCYFASNSASAGASQTVVESFPGTGGMHISYKDSGYDGHSAENQTDLIYAYTRSSKKQGVKRSDDTAIGLQFHHALAGIRFKFGEVTEGLMLTNVTLSGIKTSGECLFKDDSFTWTVGTDADTLSQSYSVTTQDGASCDGASAMRTFFIMPQDISDDASLTMTLRYSYDATDNDEDIDETIIKKVKFKDVLSGSGLTKWEAGKLYSYSLSSNVVFAELGKTMDQICQVLGYSNSKTVTSVEFSVGEKPVTEGVDVKSERSLTPINATYDSATGKLVLHTAAPKIFLKKNSSQLFYGCEKMTTVSNMASLDTRNVANMNGMFGNCYVLDSVDVSGFNTSKVTDMGSMFSSCYALAEIDVSNFDTSNVISMSGMFYECRKLSRIDVSNFNTSKVTTMASMFRNCLVLDGLNISHFDTSQVENMDSIFKGDAALTNLDVSGFNTSKVKYMGYMFSECKNIPVIDISHFDTSNVVEMEYMFSRCSAATSLNVTGFNTSNVTRMDYMFSKCTSITSLDVTGFNTGKVLNMNNMFSGCTSLQNLDVSGFNTSGVKDMGYMFENCYSLPSINVTGFVTSSVTNMAYMFSNCSKFSSLDVTSFDTSSVTDMSGMFNNCNKLTSIDVTGFNTSKVTNMSKMFCYCMGFPTFDLSGFNTSSVKNMSAMFSHCEGLTSLPLSNFDTSNVTDMSSMFSSCVLLGSIDLSQFNTSKVTTMNYMFSDSTNLGEIKLGSSFTVPTNVFHMLYRTATNVTVPSVTCTQAAKDIMITTDAAIRSDYESWNWIII